MCALCHTVYHYLFRSTSSIQRKVTVVGAGFLRHVAQRIVEKQLADVVLIDIVEGLPAREEALDMMQSAAVEGF